MASKLDIDTREVPKLATGFSHLAQVHTSSIPAAFVRTCTLTAPETA